MIEGKIRYDGTHRELKEEHDSRRRRPKGHKEEEWGGQKENKLKIL
jgi:hypothetical protein